LAYLEVRAKPEGLSRRINDYERSSLGNNAHGHSMILW